MLKSVTVFCLKARLYFTDGTEDVWPFNVVAKDGVNAQTVLEKYLAENQMDTGIKYTKVDCIWNTGTMSVVMDLQEGKNVQGQNQVSIPVCCLRA